MGTAIVSLQLPSAIVRTQWKRWRVFGLTFIALWCGALYYVFVESYAWGVTWNDWYAYRCASRETRTASASGDVLRVVLNDFGAAHSGRHFVWVLNRSSVLLPWSVVATGWTDDCNATAGDVIEWRDARSFAVRLYDKKRNGELTTRIVSVP